MCYIWRCDADAFDHSNPLHAYLQHITPWNRIPFIFDESGNAHRIHHICLNIRSSRPIICMDAFHNLYSVAHVLFWRLDQSDATWGVFDNRHAAHASDRPLFDPLLSHELPITSEQANALAQWYDEHDNGRAIARGLGFATRRHENNRANTRLNPHAPRRLVDIDERPIFERISDMAQSARSAPPPRPATPPALLPLPSYRRSSRIARMLRRPSTAVLPSSLGDLDEVITEGDLNGFVTEILST
ncbi:hypothetical protein E2P81_ATG05298 [Venturia nashicola]|uniref:Uncharacterized protein n=1 Tax=Venturia nashicola TaxID=86259 RepID=A0A4Z1P2Y9_9PEZI|nr:hypothetical protein E6O75_ATG05433 [Venturia nashicola]TLD32322.1 hypothetical protein E2P81_ATG05298 [Venturia nashicola]